MHLRRPTVVGVYVSESVLVSGATCFPARAINQRGDLEYDQPQLQYLQEVQATSTYTYNQLHT